MKKCIVQIASNTRFSVDSVIRKCIVTLRINSCLIFRKIFFKKCNESLRQLFFKKELGGLFLKNCTFRVGGILKFLRILCTIIFKTYLLDSQNSKMIISATYIMVIKLVIYPLTILSHVKSQLQSVAIQYVNL